MNGLQHLASLQIHKQTLNRTPGRESPGDNQPPRDLGVDHKFMHHKATAQIRDLRAELIGVLEHDKDSSTCAQSKQPIVPDTSLSGSLLSSSG